MACLLRNNQETEEVGVYGFSLFVSEEDAKPQLTLADHVFQTWGLFLKSLETFRAYFG